MRAKMGDNVSLGYCPLDLFSGDKDRVTKAIHSLWNAWIDSNGTVNNLKLFVRGKSNITFRRERAHLCQSRLSNEHGFLDLFNVC